MSIDYFVQEHGGFFTCYIQLKYNVVDIYIVIFFTHKVVNFHTNIHLELLLYELDYNETTKFNTFKNVTFYIVICYVYSYS